MNCPHCNQMLPEDRREGDCPVCGNPLAGYAPRVPAWLVQLGGLGVAGILFLPAALTFLVMVVGVTVPHCGALAVLAPFTFVGGSVMVGTLAGLSVAHRGGVAVSAGAGKVFWWSAAFISLSLLLCLLGFMVSLGFSRFEF